LLSFPPVLQFWVADHCILCSNNWHRSLFEKQNQIIRFCLLSAHFRLPFFFKLEGLQKNYILQKTKEILKLWAKN